jgi:hypothetical protein
VAVIDWVVALLLQMYENPAGAVSVTDPPAQKVVGPPAVIVGVLGGVFTVTVMALEIELVQPLAMT